MHLFWFAFFALPALFWTTYGLKVAYGASRLPWLKDYLPAADADCPRISLLFAARDEEKKLPEALATLVAQDYPYLEIARRTPREKSSMNLPPPIRSFASFMCESFPKAGWASRMLCRRLMRLPVGSGSCSPTPT